MSDMNTGSFGAAIGGADALKSAMQRRGMDASILDQVSPAAPGPQSPVAPNTPQSAPNLGPTPDQALRSPSPQQQPGPAARSAEGEIAAKALRSVLEADNAVAKALVGLR